MTDLNKGHGINIEELEEYVAKLMIESNAALLNFLQFDINGEKPSI